LEVIDVYRNGELTSFNFIKELEAQYAIMVGLEPISPEALDKIVLENFHSHSVFQSFIYNFLSATSMDYNPSYKFDREVLNELRNLFTRDDISQLLGHKALDVLARIDKYELSEPDLDIYSQQRYTLPNEFYFSLVDPSDAGSVRRFLAKVDHADTKALKDITTRLYWFGFLCADGSMDKTGRIEFTLKELDKKHVYHFADDMGFEAERVKKKPTKDTNTGKKHLSRRINFRCRLMVQDQKRLKKLGSHSKVKNIPPIIKALIEYAKDGAGRTGIDWKDTNAGKAALA